MTQPISQKLLTLTIMVGLCSFHRPLSFAQTPAISRAEAVELAVHRIERLISLNKLEKDFGAKLESLSLMATPASTDAEVAFEVSASQFSVAGIPTETALLNLNNAGKMLSFSTNGDGNISTASGFPDKGASTLIELALHKLEADAADPAASPFYNQLTSVKLIPVMMDMGQGMMLMSVNVAITSDAVPTILVYQIALNGQVTGRIIQ